MRETDSSLDEDVKGFARNRLLRTLAGLVIAVAGCTVAIIRPEHMVPGFLVALVGAGVVDPSLLISKLLR